MADTDLPNGFGALNRAPRPIASPIAVLLAATCRPYLRAAKKKPREVAGLKSGEN
jgi:hypothetical protein